ncbi:increased DNA methylation 1 [Helianthus annuus]|nr:increased DNA methylation 1 [Helianthus annuus]
MAADIRTQLILEQSRKRQKLNHAPKLLPNEQVEVRSVEEGLRGSWHHATVIKHMTQIRVVKYHHLFCNDNSTNLVQFIPVLFAVDGIIPTNWRPSNFPNYRGKIRPIPPRVLHNKNCYHFGQCVDVFLEDAWWEGVIFDHNDDDHSHERLVFFPDLGDESRVLSKNLRVTQDWDATTDKWRVRGDWIFLEIFEEFKVELPVFVSVKQIWYELRMTKYFVDEMKEWTCPVKENWKETVKEVMVGKFKMLMTDFLHELTFSEDFDTNPDAVVAIKSGYENLSFKYRNISDEKKVVKNDEALRTNRAELSSKRARIEVLPKYRTPRTVLTWLIDNNVVLPRAKVQYCCKNDRRLLKVGRVTRNGIKCNCCKHVFSLVKFQKHAGRGSDNGGLPSANIFLEDGRSLLDCQLQVKLDQSSRLKKRRCEIGTDSDYICSVCQYGGELVLCDQCPSSFHTSCVGLKEVPDGEWFCPSCCCRICNQNTFSEYYEEIVETNIINCEQCGKQYHIGCLKRSKDYLKLKSCLEANWFCSLRCEEIYTGLQRLLGKSIPIGKGNLTWTLRKNKTFEHSNYDSSDTEESIENYSKLNVAISVMHECFEPVKEPRTGGDIVEDVVFCRQSELRRLNFKGFYTVLLEKDDELLSTAAVRVYGEKVAEVPLVGTRFQYRRRGMCHILMQELERKLKELGVERLVLPAVSSVLHTWTRSFGFSAMTESDKFKFLGCAFLDFQGTTMCHKLLVTDPPSTKPGTSKGNRCRNILDLDRVNDVFEESQASKPRESVSGGFLKCYHRRKFVSLTRLSNSECKNM